MGTFANEMSCYDHLPGLPEHLSGQEEQRHTAAWILVRTKTQISLTHSLSSSHHHPQTNLSDPRIQHFTTKNQLFRGKRHLISFLL